MGERPRLRREAMPTVFLEFLGYGYSALLLFLTTEVLSYSSGRENYFLNVIVKFFCHFLEKWRKIAEPKTRHTCRPGSRWALQGQRAWVGIWFQVLSFIQPSNANTQVHQHVLCRIEKCSCILVFKCSCCEKAICYQNT